MSDETPHRRRRRRRRRDNGRFAETVPPEAVQDVFSAVDGPVVTTTDVADVLGVSTEAARTKLNGLVERGELRRRETGRTVVYWVADDTGGRPAKERHGDGHDE